MIKIIKAELTMLIGEIKQYYMNYIFYNLGMLILFFGLFYNYFYNSEDTNVLSMLICAVLWQICTNGIQYLCYLIQDEAMMGTLEQMFLTKTSFIKILFSKTIVNVVFVIVKGLLLFIVCTIAFNKEAALLTISIWQYLAIVCVIIITVLAFYCMGGLFGGLSLYFKRVSSVLNVVDYFLLMFTGVLNDTSNYSSIFRVIVRIIPTTNANILINKILKNSILYGDILWFVVTIIAFSSIGILGLKLLIGIAKKDGKLGQY